MKLKSTIAILFILPAISFGSTCYKASSVVPHEVPKVLCLDKLVETNPGDELLVINGNTDFPPVLTITEISRHNEDRVNFTATAVMVDVWNSGCGDGLLATLKVKGEIAYGAIDTKNLTVSVDVESTNDTCHSQPQTETITYPLF